MEFRDLAKHFIDERVPDNSKIIKLTDDLTETAKVSWRGKVVHKTITIEWEEINETYNEF